MCKFVENYYNNLFNFANSIRVTNENSGNLTGGGGPPVYLPLGTGYNNGIKELIYGRYLQY